MVYTKCNYLRQLHKPVQSYNKEQKPSQQNHEIILRKMIKNPV